METGKALLQDEEVPPGSGPVEPADADASDSVRADADVAEAVDSDAEVDAPDTSGTQGAANDRCVKAERAKRSSGLCIDIGEALERLEELDRARSRLDAQEARTVAEVHRHAAALVGPSGRPGMAESLTAAEIGCVLRIPERTAASLLEHSQLLTRHYQRTLAALEDGRLSKRHAWAVVEEATGIPADAGGFEAKLIDIAAESTVAKFGYRARRLRESLHPETITTRHTRAVLERQVELTPGRDGMSWLGAYLPAVQAAGIYQRLDTWARSLQAPDETRTLPQLRADVFADVLTHTCPVESGRSAGVGARNSAVFRGIQARVFVTVPVMTLLGGDTPGELEGYGPIDPENARMLAGHASSFTRILTHPETGARLSVGRTRYKAPRDLRDAVRVRDRTCCHPGCNRLAANSDLDHTVPWSRGGETKYSNLAAVCARHHLFKTEGYWHYQQPEPGVIKATSLAGRTYTTRPEPPPPF